MLVVLWPTFFFLFTNYFNIVPAAQHTQAHTSPAPCPTATSKVLSNARCQLVLRTCFIFSLLTILMLSLLRNTPKSLSLHASPTPCPTTTKRSEQRRAFKPTEACSTTSMVNRCYRGGFVAGVVKPRTVQGRESSKQDGRYGVEECVEHIETENSWHW
jgi:hypothetical protein